MGTLIKDVRLSDTVPTTLLLDKHIQFICEFGKSRDTYVYGMSDYLRLSGMYWSLTALDLMGASDKMQAADVVAYIASCQDPRSGGFSASVGHDPHLLHTLSAIQLLCMYDRLDAIAVDGVVIYVNSLQDPITGAFHGDQWGERDTRFSFCATMTLSLLGRLDDMNTDLAANYIACCRNFDGGYGSRPGSESHAGLVYCCVGTLSMLNRLELVDRDVLAWWLCERQLPSGGLNGRPEKLPDLCYSWWVLSSLRIIGREKWLDTNALKRFIMACQDADGGGFSDRPGNVADPFHTLFGLAALSLIDEEVVSRTSVGDATHSLRPVNATYCMRQSVIDRLQLKPQRLCDSDYQ